MSQGFRLFLFSAILLPAGIISLGQSISGQWYKNWRGHPGFRHHLDPLNQKSIRQYERGKISQSLQRSRANPQRKKTRGYGRSGARHWGKVKITWSTKGEKSTHTGWLPVDPEKDYTRKVEITNLLPGSSYEIKVESQSIEGVPGETVSGKFRTAPAPDQQSAVKFVVTTCQDYPRKDTPKGHQIYPRMLELDPDFFVHTGDIEYYDKPQPWANNQTLARFKWNRLYGLPYLSHFHTQVGSYFMKDDHDTTSNDSWPGIDFVDLTWEQGKELFVEQFPIRKKITAPSAGEKTCKSGWWKDAISVARTR